MAWMSSSEKTVLLAMSGGVDSSVAAALLLRGGYRVTGVFMCLGAAVRADGDSPGCCSPQDAADARRVAQRLGIELHVLNLSDEFERIIDYFAGEYVRGRTPNPCIHCNSWIKFGRLVRQADQLGIRRIATGHYARMAEVDASAAVVRARARAKDQSYALFEIARENLSRMLLPVGEMATKAEIRQVALDLGLNVHDKPDSQEICFVEDDDYAALLRRRAPQALTPGRIVDSSGKVLGEHDGYARYTIGQRRGLRVAGGVPLYVTRIDPASATVTIGPRDEVIGRRLTASGVNWHRDVPTEFDAVVQIRYNHEGSPARVRRIGEDRFEAEFPDGVAAITPGQAAVAYDGDTLLGGGWID
jgi:tRNA-specific 2-thiouridylase